VGERFERWRSELDQFQRRRAAGTLAEPRTELAELAAKVDAIAVDGLDYREAAQTMVQLELACICVDDRSFDEAFRLARDCASSALLPTSARGFVTATRELLLGNVLLLRDGDPAGASDHYARAIKAVGSPTLTGNALVNLGHCYGLLEQHEKSFRCYEEAADHYAANEREDQVPVSLHGAGNALFAMGKAHEAARLLSKAAVLFLEHGNKMGQWAAMDDLSRVYLELAERDAVKKSDWLELAQDANMYASGISAMVWKTFRGDPGRLKDLSEQLVNMTMTGCMIAIEADSPEHLLGTLALAKGRIRFSQFELPPAALAEMPEGSTEPLALGIVPAYTLLVTRALETLAGKGRVAVIDHFAVQGSGLVIGWATVTPDEKTIGWTTNRVDGHSPGDSTQAFRGRGRGAAIQREVEDLIKQIQSHSARCAMLLGDDPAALTADDRAQLAAWADELTPALRRLGDLFFPPDVIEMLRHYRIQHVVLSVDPLFAQVPYPALTGHLGAIIDEPWTLSVVTSTTELVRLVEREAERGPAQAVAWYGPDADVNDNRGGNAELSSLEALGSVLIHRGDQATRSAIVAHLEQGRWCHFRGHGLWTSAVDSSGIVLADDEVLSTEHYPRYSGTAGYLFTAACLTGFADVVGTEAFGSLADYDRAGLFGAVLTSWPIQGDAASVTTSAFYDELRRSEDSAAALKAAARRTRAAMPHPYLWAPFQLFGGWRCRGMLRW
jgi:tetratricopeptide (TPR) repeat protein